MAYTFLVVDDEPTELVKLKAFIKPFGTVLTASSAEEALSIYNKTIPDIIFSDYNMPNINGYEFFELLKEKNYDGMFIIITGLTDLSIAIKGIKEGIFDYIQKPAQKDYIEEVITKATNDLEKRRKFQREAHYYKTIIDLLPDELLVINPENFKITEMNKKATKTLSSLGYNMFNYLKGLTKENLKEILDLLTTIGREDYSVLSEMNFEKEDGKLSYREINFSLIEGKLLGVSRAVDDRKNLESQILKDKTLLEKALEISKQVAFEFNFNNQKTNLLHSLNKLGGIKITNRHGNLLDLLSSIVHPEDTGILNKLIKTFQSLEKEPQKAEIRILQKDDTYGWYLTMTRIIQNENRENILIGTIRDISEEKNEYIKLKTTKEQLKQLNHRFIKVQEQERKNLGQNLHDDFGQKLTAMKMKIDYLKNLKDIEVIKNEMDQCEKVLSSLIKDVQKLSSGLIPPILDDLNLESSINWIINNYSNVDINFTTHINLPEKQIDKDIQLTIYRVIQESITNIIRHSKATSATLNIDYDGNFIKFEIIDNGIGFKLNSIYSLENIGLYGMKERIESFGGEINIKSIPNKGTTIVGKVPLSI